MEEQEDILRVHAKSIFEKIYSRTGVIYVKLAMSGDFTVVMVISACLRFLDSVKYGMELLQCDRKRDEMCLTKVIAHVTNR